MKRISYSYNPTVYQVGSISSNLREKFDKTFNVEIQCWAYNYNSAKHDTETQFQISILPGFTENSCSIKYFTSWSSLLSWYLKVMKEGLLSD